MSDEEMKNGSNVALKTLSRSNIIAAQAREIGEMQQLYAPPNRHRSNHARVTASDDPDERGSA